MIDPRALPFDPIDEAKRQWDVHWGPDAVPAVGAVTSIMRAQQVLMARLNEILAPFELTFPRYEALMLLFYSSAGSLPLGKIGDRLQVHRASVTYIIDRLEDAGFVRRLQHESDRRAILAEITAPGRDVAERSTREMNAASFGIEALDRDELAELFRLLRPLRRDAGDF